MKEYFDYFCIEYCLQIWRRTMIKEIIKLREDGLSFRKIASQLNTTVGRVQYRWNKYVNNRGNQTEEFSIKKDRQIEDSEIVLNQPKNDYSADKGRITSKTC